MADLIEAAKAEVLRRHAFFVAWFTGKADNDALAETARAFAPDFHMLWPDMTMDRRDTLLAKLQDARGQSPENYTIEIVFVHTAIIDAQTAVVVCDEHQVTGDSTNKRRMSAVFSRAADAPEGVQWRHLHQTWLAE